MKKLCSGLSYALSTENKSQILLINILLAKMKAYGFHDSAIKLIQSYLLGRFQQVKCNGKVSDWLPLRCGVPQGNLLGPLFVISL